MSSIFSKIKAFFTAGKASSKTSSQGTGEIHTGIIAHFNWSKGYGFVESPDLEGRIFLHRTRLKGRVKVGDPVQFELGRNAKGLFVKRILSK